MGTTFVISPRVINTINSLPAEERLAVTSALAAEMILGAESVATGNLTPMQEVIYTMIKKYVQRDTERVRQTTGFSA